MASEMKLNRLFTCAMHGVCEDCQEIRLERGFSQEDGHVDALEE